MNPLESFDSREPYLLRLQSYSSPSAALWIGKVDKHGVYCVQLLHNGRREQVSRLEWNSLSWLCLRRYAFVSRLNLTHQGWEHTFVHYPPLHTSKASISRAARMHDVCPAFIIVIISPLPQWARERLGSKSCAHCIITKMLFIAVCAPPRSLSLRRGCK
jgi:hypothetical protein